MSDEFSWRTGRSCVFRNFVHLIFVTKYRRGVLTAEMLQRLEEVYRETCTQMDGELLEFGGEDDHVHLLVSCPTKLAVSVLVNRLKGKSSYYMRKEFWTHVKKKLWGTHFWSPSYCAVSAGGAPLEILKEYVASQRRPPTLAQIERSAAMAKHGGLKGRSMEAIFDRFHRSSK